LCGMSRNVWIHTFYIHWIITRTWFWKTWIRWFRKSIPILRICFHTTPCSNNFPCECIRNVQYSYILPHPFNREVEDSYLLVNLWVYLVGLSKSSNTLDLLKRIHMGNIELQDKPQLESKKKFCIICHL
jgi:hypothetical protein